MADDVFKIQISDGVADPVEATAGTLIAITANSKTSIGKEFKQWVAQNGAVLDNPYSETTTFIMPASNVVLGVQYVDIPIQITVRNGSYVSESGTNYYGSRIKITANDRVKEGYKFSHWNIISGADAILEDPNSSISYFILGVQEVLIEAVYEYILYDINLQYATPSSYTGHVGEIVTITALNRDNEGKVFREWHFTKGTPFNAKRSPTTITFGADELVGEALYNDIFRNVTIISGKSDKAGGIKGETITITANDRTPEGYKFKEWILRSGDITIGSTKDAQTTFEIVLEDVEVEATYEFIEYSITVRNATVDKTNAHVGETINLVADDKTLSNLKFSEWEILKGSINIAQEISTSFTMVPSDVEIEAKYVQRVKPDASNYLSLYGIPDKLYGIIESKINYSKNNVTNSGDREFTFKWTTPNDGQQGELLRDTIYNVVEACFILSKNQNS